MHHTVLLFLYLKKGVAIFCNFLSLRLFAFLLGIFFLYILPSSSQDNFQSWTRTYNGSGGSDGSGVSSDEGKKVVTDASGNVYVAGTISNLIVGNTTYDFFIRKYTSSGSVVWTKIYNSGTNYHDQLYDMTIDASANIYVTGRATYAGVTARFLTIKYNTSGTLLWAKTYNVTDIASVPNKVVVDAAGNVYVTGVRDQNYITIKYNSAGTQLWAKTYDNGANTYDQAYDMAVDGSGNVYVTGHSASAAEGFYNDYATIKYNSSGVQQWVKRYDGIAGNSDDMAKAIALDASGNIYVTGRSEGGASFDDYATVKYNPSGTQVWVKRYNAGSYDQANAIVIDGSGNIIVTGHSGLSGENDFLTIKYNSSGTVLWTKRFDGSNEYKGDDYPTQMKTDGSNNVYITGYGNNSANDDVLTIKYNSSGKLLWSQRFQTGGGYEYGYSLALDQNRNVYVTGASDFSNGPFDILTIKYVNPANNHYPLSATPVTTCSGSFYDPGYTLNYKNEGIAYISQTFSPDNSQAKLKVAFSSFNLVSGQDYLYIYDGSSTASPLIGGYTGTSSPGTVTATNSSGKLTFLFYRTSLSGAPGWSASLSCIGGLSVVRLNSGGPAWTNFSADNYFGGTTATFSTSTPIDNTTLDPAYQTYRGAAAVGGSFGYKIPVVNGKYNVKLFFAELNHSAAGKRKFNVGLEGTSWLSNYDIFAAAGAAFKAVTVTKTVTVTDGYLSLSFTSLVDKACVNAVEVYPAPVARVAEAEEELVLDNAILLASPNPASSKTVFKFSLPQKQHANIDVYNSKGEHVSQLFDGIAEAGKEYHLEWNTSLNSQGIYFGRLVTAEKVYHRKVIVIK